MDDGDDETGDNRSVFEEVERNEGVSSSEFLPEHESDHSETSDDKEGNGSSCNQCDLLVIVSKGGGMRKLTIAPSRTVSVGGGDGDEDHSGTSNEEDQSDDVQFVEVSSPSSLCAGLLENNDSRSFFGDLLDLIHSRSDGQTTHRLSFSVPESGENRQSKDGDEDCKSIVSALVSRRAESDAVLWECQKGRSD